MVLQRRHLLLPSSDRQKISLLYHHFFGFPLSLDELKKWKAGRVLRIKSKELRIEKIKSESGFFFLGDKRASIEDRLKREKISQGKIRIAKKVAKYLFQIPTIKMVAITGSLAMQNSDKNSDIDLMVVTKEGLMWTTRLMTLLYLRFLGVSVRKAGQEDKKNKICINIWMDEKDLVIDNRNIYTAHEIAQIIPLINREKTYEKFIYKNRWIKNYWPNALPKKLFIYTVSYVGKKKNLQHMIYDILYIIFETLAYYLQLRYMETKMTREIVTKTRAFFHPYDWSTRVLNYLKKNGVYEDTR